MNVTVDRKVLVGAAMGGLVTFVAWILNAGYHVTMTAEAALGLSTALTFIIQYLVPNAPTEEADASPKKD